MSAVVSSSTTSRVVVNKTNQSTTSVNSPLTENTVISSKVNNPPANIVVKKAQEMVLQSITNINSDNLQDGYTLVYDAGTGEFVFSPITSAVTSVDGGTY